MENVFSTASRWLEAGISFAYAAIISQDGSAPRGAGTRMLIRSDCIEATIGGGLMEAQVIQQARQEVLPRRHMVQMHFDLSGEQAASAEFICGGRCEILICYVDAENPAHRQLFATAHELTITGGSGWLIMALNRLKNQVYLCLSVNGNQLVGEYDPSFMLPEAQLLHPTRIAIHGGDNPDIRYIIHPVRTSGTVYLFGAGHVSLQVARITNMLEFTTVVVDDREEFLTEERFPNCQRLQLESLERLPELPIDTDSYILIITRGHTHDQTVLRWALNQPVGYIGMIGSIQKRDQIYKDMIADGYSPQRLEQVYSPIGLAIGGQTPAEIAVSIAAQLVQVRAAQQKGTA